MQISAELDAQHWEKLRILESRLQKNTSELISLAIDQVYQLQNPESDAEKAYQIMLQTGFIGSIQDNGNLSENYKAYMDWTDKL